MRPHELRRFAILSKSVRVVSRGKTYELDEIEEPSLDDAIAEIRSGQKRLLKAVEANTEALYQPVVPSYENGKLVGAQRARKE